MGIFDLGGLVTGGICLVVGHDWEDYGSYLECEVCGAINRL